MDQLQVSPSETDRDPPASRRRGEELLSPSFTFLKVRGISIGAHWSWVLVFVLISWSLSTQLFPRAYPGLGRNHYLVMGLAAAVIFFASVVLHELGHAFQAVREGMKVGDITLWLFGGVARFEGMFPSAGAEFRIAIAGPVVSVVLAALFALISRLSSELGFPVPVKAVASYLGGINAILVAFNLVPALPLDGGRVLRAWLWHKQRSFTAATLSAAKAGKAFGYLLIAVGLAGFFTQASTGGVWFIFLGWFLLQAAQAEASYALVRKAFHDVTVRQLMTPHPVTVSPHLSISSFFETVRPRAHAVYPVAEDGSLLGLISLRQAGEVPLEQRDSMVVEDLMMPADKTPRVQLATPVMAGLETLRSGPGRAVVVHEGKIVGILSVSDVAKALELEQARGVQEPGAKAAGRLVWVVVGLVMLLAAGALYHPPLAVLAPAPALDVSKDISISGMPVSKLEGRYLLVAVSLEQRSALGALYALIHPDQDVAPLSSVVPEGVPDEEFSRRQKEVFVESRMLAAAAAARAAGLEVTSTGGGARVVSVVRGSPAREVLRRGDIITAVDGNRIALSSDLRGVISSKPVGSRFDLTVKRRDRELNFEIASSRIQGGDESGPAIGVLVETADLDVDLPFEVKFDERDIGGPSAGLAYALAITDMIDPKNLSEGRTVAASGTIQLDGHVGEVGGLTQKAAGAEAAGAELFLVPSREVDRLVDENIEIRGVDTLQEAIAILQPS